MKLTLEQISAVSGGVADDTLEPVEFMPVKELDGVFMGRCDDQWIVAVDGVYKFFNSEQNALYCIDTLLEAKRIYEQGFDTDYIDD